jgi:hypothetical protein
MIDFNPVVQEDLQSILAMDYGIEPISDTVDAELALFQSK